MVCEQIICRALDSLRSYILVRAHAKAAHEEGKFVVNGTRRLRQSGRRFWLLGWALLSADVSISGGPSFRRQFAQLFR